MRFLLITSALTQGKDRDTQSAGNVDAIDLRSRANMSWVMESQSHSLSKSQPT